MLKTFTIALQACKTKGKTLELPVIKCEESFERIKGLKVVKKEQKSAIKQDQSFRTRREAQLSALYGSLKPTNKVKQ